MRDHGLPKMGEERDWKNASVDRDLPRAGALDVAEPSVVEDDQSFRLLAKEKGDLGSWLCCPSSLPVAEAVECLSIPSPAVSEAGWGDDPIVLDLLRVIAEEVTDIHPGQMASHRVPSALVPYANESDDPLTSISTP